MIKISFEFRKGIFFIRLIGNLNHESIKKVEEIIDIVKQNQFKNIVININYIKTIDITSLNFLAKTYYYLKKYQTNLVFCDKHNIIMQVLNKSIPSIKDELEIL